jgi:hypothetical protein
MLTNLIALIAFIGSFISARKTRLQNNRTDA